MTSPKTSKGYTVIEGRNQMMRAQALQSIYALSLQVNTGLKASRINFVKHAKEMGWTIPSATKERALIDVVAAAIRGFGYRIQKGSTVARALSEARKRETARMERRRAPKRPKLNV